MTHEYLHINWVNTFFSFSSWFCWPYQSYNYSQRKKKEENKSYEVQSMRRAFITLKSSSSRITRLALCTKNSLITFSTLTLWIPCWFNKPKTSIFIHTLNKNVCFVASPPKTFLRSNLRSAKTYSFFSWAIFTR